MGSDRPGDIVTLNTRHLESLRQTDVLQFFVDGFEETLNNCHTEVDSIWCSAKSGNSVKAVVGNAAHTSLHARQCGESFVQPGAVHIQKFAQNLETNQNKTCTFLNVVASR